MLSRFYGMCRGRLTQATNCSMTISRKYTAPAVLLSDHETTKTEKKVEQPRKKAQEKRLPIISCKRKEFNFYGDEKYGKFEAVPLASKGWQHRKSKGDHFTIDHSKDSSNTETEDLKKKPLPFEQSGLDPEIIERLDELNLQYATKIQELGIPAILSGQNTLLAAETGCGKTLAYLLPVIQQIQKWKSKVDRKFNTPLVLILCPNRELALQIGHVAKSLTRGIDISTRVILGGRTKSMMKNPIVEKVDLLVGTLGAISKLTTNHIYNMSKVRHVVLDEADTMLDDSFSEKLKYFLGKVKFRYIGAENDDAFPRSAQLTLVSATMPTSVPEVLGEIINPDSLVNVTTSDLHRILPHVPQKFLRVSRNEKPSELLRIIKSNVLKRRPTIVFSNKAPTCDWLRIFLEEANVRCTNLNGDMPMHVRKGKFAEFQNGSVDVLSTTDAGSRGLDTVRVKQVINYDFPTHMADYIHRCGRTGRVGSPSHCQVISFVSLDQEVQLVRKIEMATRKMAALPNVDGNITRIITDKMRKELGELEDEQESSRIPI